MLYPLTFHPILKERVWGGRKLAELYDKTLPPDAPIGESWEISDRPGDISVVANGPLAGKDLHWLMANHDDGAAGGGQASSRPVSAAAQDPRRAGKTFAPGSPAARQSRGIRRRTEDGDVVHRERSAGGGIVRRAKARRDAPGVRAKAGGWHRC